MPVNPQPQQQVPKVVSISFSAEIVPNTVESLLQVCANLANQGVKTVYLQLSTAGGSVQHGLTAYNVLRSMPFKLITHNVGNVDSIGNVVFLAGEERYACQTATFMFHGVGAGVPQNVRLAEKDLREKLDGLVADQQRITSVIVDRSNIDAAEVEEMFLEGRTKDPVYAKKVGIVHDIRDVQLPLGTPIHQLVFQR